MRVLLLVLVLLLIGEDASAQVARSRRRPRPTVPPPPPWVRNNSLPLPEPVIAGPPAPLPLPLGAPSVALRPVATVESVPDPSWLTPGTDPILARAPRAIADAGAGRPPATVARAEESPRAPRRWRGAVRVLGGAIQQPASLVRVGVPGSVPFVPNGLVMAGLEADRRLLPWLAPYVTLMGGFGQMPHVPIIRSLGFAPLSSYTMVSGLAAGGLLLQAPLGPFEPYLRGGGGYRATFVDFPALVVWQVSPTTDLGTGLRIRFGRFGLSADARRLQSAFDGSRLPVFRLPGATVTPIRETLVTFGVQLGIR